MLDLEKEEEEQKRVEKVMSIFMVITSYLFLCSPMLMVSFSCGARNMYGGPREKTVMHFVHFWKNMSLLAFLQPRHTGWIIALRCLTL